MGKVKVEIELFIDDSTYNKQSDISDTLYDVLGDVEGVSGISMDLDEVE